MTSYIATVRVALFLLLTSVTVQGRDAGNTAPRRLRRLRAAIDNSSVAAIAQFTEDACNAAQEYRCPSGPQRCKETLYWNRTAGRCDLVKAESQNRSGGNPADGVRDYECNKYKKHRVGVGRNRELRKRGGGPNKQKTECRVRYFFGHDICFRGFFMSGQIPRRVVRITPLFWD
eukprot:GEMP01074152.1.p1 GENE.GEMP01074152.1~~GEMP01074152.1.p1  ORF type:complete len:174 (+),score=16.97 GEMP01074152.1:294-815(+)